MPLVLGSVQHRPALQRDGALGLQTRHVGGNDDRRRHRPRDAREGALRGNGQPNRTVRGGESIRGEGLLVVEWGRGTDDDPDEPWYRIAVACPGAGGLAPADMNGSVETYTQPRRSGFAAFEGTVQEAHPDADPDNGVTGTWSLMWSLALHR